jgi:hypothetical protein
MRLKGKAEDLGEARSGKAGEDHGGRCAAGGAGRKKGKEKRALLSEAKWSEREHAEEAAMRAGLRAGRRRRRTERELSGPARGRKRWATGKEAGLRGREGKQAGLG